MLSFASCFNNSASFNLTPCAAKNASSSLPNSLNAFDFSTAALEMVEFKDGSKGMALNLESDNVGIVIFGVDVPDEIIKRLEEAKDQKEESKKICIELIEAFRNIQGVKGVHLMGHKKEVVISEIIKESKK